MFLPFFERLRREAIPVSLREYLAFLEGMQAGLVTYDIDGFYYFARAAMVKDERHLDKFDRAFSASFEGLESLSSDDVLNAVDLPDAWLRREAEKFLSPQELDEIERLGGFDKLMETLKQRLAEQKGRHQGGNKWIGTGGTSPFGGLRVQSRGACASARTARAMVAPSRSGTNAISGTSTTVWNLAPAT